MSAASKQDDVFVFVKAYASRGTLLSRAFLEELANSRSIDEMASKLKSTAYGEQITTGAGGTSARRLESMLRSSLSVFNFELMKYYRKPGFLQGYFERNLSWNLKVAIKGKAMGSSYEELNDMIVLKAEELAGRRDLIVRILSAANLDQVVALLSDSDIKPFIVQALAAFRINRDVSIFDLYIDRYTMGKLVRPFTRKKGRLRRFLNRPNPVVKSIVASDVDSFDILAVLRSKWLDLPASKAKELVVTPAFFLDEETLEEMISANGVQAAAGKLNHTIYRRLVPTAAAPEALISGLEDAFYEKTLKTARRTFSSYPMSEPILLGALKAKEVEVRNLSTVAFGLEVGLQPSQIVAKLIST
ncbi:MAG TPA: V-type ATPase subunit [Conexivisphaerales archaeon]|nr:V-type ATPase subunit [Conexivisphaerales archaeon]